jgi:hypothetical protein
MMQGLDMGPAKSVRGGKFFLKVASLASEALDTEFDGLIESDSA